ncbi:MAG: outer membrane protein assembly factor BamD [Geminicoccaceae bacterium]
MATIPFTHRTLCALGLAAALAACSSGPEPPPPDLPAEQLYSDGQNLMAEGDFKAAAKSFEEVERQHPYSQWATRGQIMAAYSYYEANQYEDAVSAAERFIDLHPGHKDVAYAYYLIGVSYYEQISDVGRDQEMTQKSEEAFNELIRRFPQSDYSQDAELKVDLIRDHLAGKEMEIGRYYQNQRYWLASINRFRTVVEQYQTTSHVPEALHRLTESYLALGMTEEAQASAAVLGYNFPGSEWYERAYALVNGKPLNKSSSWFSGLF